MVHTGSCAVACEPDFYRLLRSFGRPNVRDGVPRKCAKSGCLELIIVQPFAGNSDGDLRPREHLVQLDPVDEKTSGDADQEKIKAGSYAAPKMNLKKRSSYPHALGAPPQAFQERGAIAHRIPCANCLRGFKRTSRPTRYRTITSTRRGMSPSKSE